MWHWSNAGIRLSNHGQDFATVTFRLNSGILGIGNTDQSTLHQPFKIDLPLAPNPLESELLP